MPLILPSQRLIRPNPLAYPAGAVAGIDPAHPALTGATRLWCSAVANNGLFVQVAPTCQVASIDTAGAGSYSTRIDGLAGPCTRGGSGSLTYGFPTSLAGAVVPSPLTFAAVVNVQDITTTFQTIMTLGSTGSAHAYFYITAGVLELFFTGTGANDAVGISFKIGHSYFVAASSSPAGINFVSRDLGTGIIQTSSLALANAATSMLVNTVTFCNDSFGDTGPNAVACGAAIQNFLSIPQLLQWAADPWAFWYPRRTIQYTTPATTTTSGGARIRQRFNRSLLAYPAGAVPGVDPSHPAVKGLIGSVIPMGNSNNAVNLGGSPFQVGTSGVVVTAAMDGVIGPACTFNPSSGSGFPILFPNSIPVPNDPMIAGDGFTFATIFRAHDGGASNNNMSGCALGQTNGVYQTIIGASGNFGLRWVATTSYDSGIAPVYGAPYFHIAAARFDGSNIIHSHVILRMDTGRLTVVNPITTASAAPSGFGSFLWGGSNPQAGSTGVNTIAASMVSTTILTVPQMLQFAADPWSFWYPRSMQPLFTQAGTPVVTTQYAAFSIPQHSLSQLANRMIGY